MPDESNYYTLDENPDYTSEIRKLQNDDLANASTVFNPLIGKLINNTHAVKVVQEQLQSIIDNTAATLGKRADDHDIIARRINWGVLT